MILLNKFLADKKIRIYFYYDNIMCIDLQFFYAEFIKGSPRIMRGYNHTYKMYATYTSMDRGINIWHKKHDRSGIYMTFNPNITISVGAGYVILTSKSYSGKLEDFINKLINEYKA